MKNLILKLIKIYQLTFSPSKGIFAFLAGGPACRFYPDCSEYARLAVEKYGAASGLVKALFRLLRCGPWSKGGIDPP